MEYRHNPGGFSGKASARVTITCDRCGTTLDVLYQQDAAASPTQPYSVRCPNHACNAILHADLSSPPIALIPRHEG
jgi:hypothetical protein